MTKGADLFRVTPIDAPPPTLREQDAVREDIIAEFWFKFREAMDRHDITFAFTMFEREYYLFEQYHNEGYTTFQWDLEMIRNSIQKARTTARRVWIKKAFECPDSELKEVMKVLQREIDRGWDWQPDMDFVKQARATGTSIVADLRSKARAG
jgi:hypothetical protein